MATPPEYKLKCSSTLHRPKDGVAFFSSNDPTENIMSNGTSVSASVSFRRPDGGTTNGYLAMASAALSPTEQVPDHQPPCSAYWHQASSS